MVDHDLEAVRQFAYCPRCGAIAGAPVSTGAGPFRCATCGFVLFFNAASAVAALIAGGDGRLLFIRRARDPGKGKLGMPGGFVDPGEDAETALRREVLEEVGLELTDVEYLSSHPNRYFYAGVTYNTLDLFYTARAVHPDRAGALDAVESLEWIAPAAIELDRIAFDSMRAAITRYRGRTAG